MLNVKQEAFCLHYAKTGNATEAYKKAGYKPKNDNSAGANARRLLQKDKIKARLVELSKELASEKIANIKEIQERLTAILRGEDAEERTSVNSHGEVEKYKVINQLNQIRSAELLAKMQGGFDNKVQVEITVPVFGGEEDLED